MGNSMEAPVLTESTATISTSNSTPGYICIGRTKDLTPKEIFTPMFMALFKTAKTQGHSKCPLTDGWFRKWDVCACICYKYTYILNTMEYHSAIKNNEALPFAAT